MNSNQLKNLLVNQPRAELLTTGGFSPLTGFMKQIDYESVLDRMRLESKKLWPIPICLDVPESQAASFEIGQSVTLRDAEGFLLGILNIEDIWPVDIKKEARAVYNTQDTSNLTPDEAAQQVMLYISRKGFI
ncbi:MAG: hypothetical protein L3J69_08550 [Desulfobacula sp.]|nr:hypothetical protein [Desulfobacula sp.]